MKFYLAARYSRREELKQIATILLMMDHKVTSSWLETNWPIEQEGSSHAPSEFRQKFAKQDVEDVLACDCLVAFTEPPGSGGRRGGRHVEFGIAVAAGKQLVVIGEPEHIFHHLEKVMVFSDITLFLANVKKYWNGV